MTKITDVLSSNYKIDSDQIWQTDTFVHNRDQKGEITCREVVAAREYNDYLEFLHKFHSIDVMDREVEKVIKTLPENVWILDVGGCWGVALAKNF